MASPDLSKLTAIIHTCDRPRAIRRLLRSLGRYYPNVRKLVADDSTRPAGFKGAETLKLPSRKGQSGAQNALLARVRTPYFLLLNDRAEFTPQTQLERLLAVVADNKLDLAGGSVTECERRFWFFVRRSDLAGHGIFEAAGAYLALQSGYRSQGDGFHWCDFVPDFYVGRTDKIRSLGGWDPELLDAHREEFFYRAHRQGLRVGCLPEVVINQWREPASRDEAISQPDMRSLAVAKMGLLQMTTPDGHVFRAPRPARAA